MYEKTLTIFDISDYFLSKENMSPKKLQKLVYYAYSWYITLYSEKPNELNRLFDERPQAWIHGPVFAKLYDRYREYSWNEIERKEINNEKINGTIVSFLDDVWKNYGNFSADELEFLTHHEQPWIEARNGKSPMQHCSKFLDDKNIFNYYISLIKDVK